MVYMSKRSMCAFLIRSRRSLQSFVRFSGNTATAMRQDKSARWLVIPLGWAVVYELGLMVEVFQCTRIAREVVSSELAEGLPDVAKSAVFDRW